MFLGRFPIFDISVNGKYTNVCKVDAAITSWIGIALLYTWSPQQRHIHFLIVMLFLQKWKCVFCGVEMCRDEVNYYLQVLLFCQLE